MKSKRHMICYLMMNLVIAHLLVLSFITVIASVQTTSPSAPSSQPARKEINRNRAIEIARQHLNFKPKSIKAVKMIEDKRKVWRVTFHGKPISKIHPMGETIIVSLDRFTGEIVSISKS